MNGEITKEAVSLMRRAAEITNNEEIKFAAAHIQSEYDKKHPRVQEPIRRGFAEKSKLQSTYTKPMNRSSSAPNVSSEKKKLGPLPAPTLQSQLPKKRWTPRNNLPNTYHPKGFRNPSDTTPSLPITKEEAAQLQSIADRTKNPELKSLSKKLQHSVVIGSRPTESTHVTTDEALEASKSGSEKTADFAPIPPQSIASTSPVGVDFRQSAYLPVIWKDGEAFQPSASLAGDQGLRNAQGLSDTTGYSPLPVVEINQVTTSETSQLQSFPNTSQNIEVKEFSKETHVEERGPLLAGEGTS